MSLAKLSLSSWPPWPLIFGSINMASILCSGLSIREWLVTPTTYVVLLHQHLLQAVHLWRSHNFSWVGHYLSTLEAYRMPSSTMNTGKYLWKLWSGICSTFCCSMIYVLSVTVSFSHQSWKACDTWQQWTFQSGERSVSPLPLLLSNMDCCLFYWSWLFPDLRRNHKEVLIWFLYLLGCWKF